jgi:hypothetical protein
MENRASTLPGWAWKSSGIAFPESIRTAIGDFLPEDRGSRIDG